VVTAAGPKVPLGRGLFAVGAAARSALATREEMARELAEPVRPEADPAAGRLRRARPICSDATVHLVEHGSASGGSAPGSLVLFGGCPDASPSATLELAETETGTALADLTSTGVWSFKDTNGYLRARMLISDEDDNATFDMGPAVAEPEGTKHRRGELVLGSKNTAVTDPSDSPYLGMSLPGVIVFECEDAEDATATKTCYLWLGSLWDEKSASWVYTLRASMRDPAEYLAERLDPSEEGVEVAEVTSTVVR
jgi:hypothetical protein